MNPNDTLWLDELPHECWAKILSYVTEPQDLLHCAEASCYFLDLMKAIRIWSISYSARSVTTPPILYWQNWASLLEIVGNQIWTCTMRCNFLENEDGYRIIHQWLSLMPNLKSLDIWLRETSSSSYHDFPTFPVLQNLDVLKCSWISNQVLSNILGQNSHVSKLSLQMQSQIGMQSPLVYDTLRSLGQLKELELLNVSVADLVHLRSANWPYLKSLTVEIGTTQGFNVNSLFHSLEYCAKEVDDLSLTFPVGSKGANTADEWNVFFKSRLNLPRVKFLVVDLLDIPTIDFILPMKSLQRLEIATRLDKGEPSTSGIQMFGVVSQMENSDIWRCLPRLESIFAMNISGHGLKCWGHHYERNNMPRSGGRISRRAGVDTCTLRAKYESMGFMLNEVI